MTEDDYKRCTDKEKVILLEGWMQGKQRRRRLALLALRSYHDNGEYKGFGLNASQDFLEHGDPVDDLPNTEPAL